MNIDCLFIEKKQRGPSCCWSSWIRVSHYNIDYFKSDANAPQAGRPGEVSKRLNFQIRFFPELRSGTDTESESTQEQCQC